MATFGNTATGGSTLALALDNKRFSRFQVPSDCHAITSLSAYLNRTGSGTAYDVRFGIYTDNSGAPNAFVSGSDLIQSNIARNSPQTYTVTYSSPLNVTPGAYLWLGVQAAKAIVTYYNAGATNQQASAADTYSDGYASSFGTPTYANSSMEVYATYTPPTPISGTAPLIAVAPNLAGSGTYTPKAITGTITLVGPAPTALASGTSAMPVTGTVSLTSVDPVLAGSGKQIFAGVSGLAAGPPTLAATGTYTPRAIEGTVSLVAPSPTLDADATYTPFAISGTAQLAASSPILDADGTYTPLAISGSSDLAAPSPTLDSDGEIEVTGFSGSASLIGPVPTLVSSGSYTPLAISGNATLTAPAPTVAASGSASLEVSGTISLAGPTPNLAATGENRIILHPTSDIDDGLWTDQAGGSDLFEAINEEPPSTADYIMSEKNPADSPCAIGCGNLGAEPSSGTRYIKYVYGKDLDAETLNITVELMQGLTVLQTWTHNDVPVGWTTAQQEITAEIVDWVTPFAVRITGDTV